MIREGLIFIAVMLLVVSLQASEISVTKDASIMPQSFEFEGKRYNVSNDFNVERNITIRHDLDQDGQIETIIGFQARNVKDEIPISFIVIGKEKNDELEPEYVIPGNEYFYTIELKDVDNDGLNEIIFWQNGGVHYTSLNILKYHNHTLKSLFSDGSACSIGIEGDVYPYKIKVGREQWEKEGWCYATGEPLWQVYVWNGKKFIFSKELSTDSHEISENEATERYVDKVMKALNRKGKR